MSSSLPRRLRWAAAAACLVVAAGAVAPAGAAAQVDLPDTWRAYASGDEIIAAAVDPNDRRRVWVGTEGGGVVQWTLSYGAGRVTGEFTQVLAPNEPGLASNTINDIAFDPRAGDVWLATGHGVTHVVGGRWSTEVLEDGMPDATVFSAVLVGADGTLWAGTPEDGLARRAPNGQWSIVEPDAFINDDAEPRAGPGSDRIAAMALDARGRVWVVHGRGGVSERPAISRFDPATGDWTHIAEGGPRGDPTERPMTAQILDIAIDPDTDEVWLATWSRGVARYDPATDAWTQWLARDPDTRADTGLCGDETWAVAAEGGVAWVACGSTNAGRGVARFDGRAWTTLDAARGLPGDAVTAIVPAGDWVLLGTDSRVTGAVSYGGAGLVAASNTGTGVPTVGAALLTAGDTPAANEITALAFDGRGHLWAGTNGGGLMEWDPSTRLWRRERWDPSGMGLPGDTVTDLLVDGDELWVAATETVLSGGRYVDGGVAVRDVASGAWTVLDKPEPLGAPYGKVSSLARLADGRVAMGLGAGTGGPGRDPQNGKGIAFYDPATSGYDYDDYALSGGNLNGDTVLDLAVDGTDLWAATSYFADPSNDARRTGGGAARFDGRRWAPWGNGVDGFASYADGLITGDGRAVHVDPSGDVWVGTWSLVDGELTSTWPYVDAVVDHWDGRQWQSDAFEGAGWVAALVADTEGRLWAGTTRGHRQEYWPATGVVSERASSVTDAAEGGLRILDGTRWIVLSPDRGNLPVRAITALAIEPATGHVWVGTQSGGILVYEAGTPLGPTRTPGPTRTAGPSPTPGPTYTPRPTDPPPVVTVAPTAIGPGSGGTPTRIPVPFRPETDEPTPPSEVPEASTWLMMLVGLATVGAWWAWRRRAVGAAGP